MLKKRIAEITGASVEQNQIFDFKIKWTIGGERIAPLTANGLQGLIEEHGNPSPHDGLSKISSIELDDRQIWP